MIYLWSDAICAWFAPNLIGILNAWESMTVSDLDTQLLYIYIIDSYTSDEYKCESVIVPLDRVVYKPHKIYTIWYNSSPRPALTITEEDNQTHKIQVTSSDYTNYQVYIYRLL